MTIAIDGTSAAVYERIRISDRHGFDEVLFKPFTTWATQTADFTPLAAPTRRLPPGSTPEGPPGNGRVHPCAYLWESLVIAWNGVVVPCCFDYDTKEALGDITRQSLREIWNGAPYQRLRRMELDGCNDSPLCSGCTEAPARPRKPRWPLPSRR